MGSVKIITDSTCDVPEYLLKQYDISLVPLRVRVGGRTYLDRREIGSSDLLRRPDVVQATTLPPEPDSFEHLFRTITRNGDSALVITLSSKLSETYQVAIRARDSITGRTAANIAVVDSLSASMGLGMMVLTAAKAAMRGNLSLLELAAMATRMVGQAHVVFFVESYEHLQRGGRAARIAPLLEQAATTRYLLRLDEGQIVPFERARTRAKAIEGLYNFVEDFPYVEEMSVLHNGATGEVEQLLTRIHTVYPRERILVTEYSAVLSTHLGPNALGVAVYEGDDH